MANIIQTKEILISTRNQLGLLLDISQTLSTEGFNIDAISAHAAGNFALIGIITDDNQRASRVLGEKGYVVVENNVIRVELEHKPGILKEMTNKLKAKKIDIVNIYGAALTECDKGILVFSTTDNQQAFSILKTLFKDLKNKS